MDLFQNFNSMNELYNIISLLVPEGTEKEYELDGTKIHISRKDGEISISTSKNVDVFDDSSIKEEIKEFKENLNDLDDDIFIDAFEKVKESIDINRFNELIEYDNFTEAEANEVEGMMSYFSQIVYDTIQDEIQRLEKMRDNF